MKKHLIIALIILSMILNGCNFLHTSGDPLSQYNETIPTYQITTDPTEDNETVPHAYGYDEGVLSEKPWISPNFPHSPKAINDPTTAEAVAECLVRTHSGYTDYSIKTCNYDQALGIWIVSFQNPDNTQMLTIELDQNSCQIINTYLSSINNAVTESDMEELSWSIALPTKETAVEIVEILILSWDLQGGFGEPFEVQSVFYETSEGCWIISAWPEVDYPSSEIITIAINEKNCCILNKWLYELGY